MHHAYCIEQLLNVHFFFIHGNLIFRPQRPRSSSFASSLTLPAYKTHFKAKAVAGLMKLVQPGKVYQLHFCMCRQILQFLSSTSPLAAFHVQQASCILFGSSGVPTHSALLPPNCKNPFSFLTHDLLFQSKLPAVRT